MTPKQPRQHELQEDKVGHWDALLTKLKSPSSRCEKCRLLLVYLSLSLSLSVAMPVGRDGGHQAERCKEEKKKEEGKKDVQPEQKQVKAIRDAVYGGLCPP